jgi:hypothetical protein
MLTFSNPRMRLKTGYQLAGQRGNHSGTSDWGARANPFGRSAVCTDWEKTVLFLPSVSLSKIGGLNERNLRAVVSRIDWNEQRRLVLAVPVAFLRVDGEADNRRLPPAGIFMRGRVSRAGEHGGVIEVCSEPAEVRLSGFICPKHRMPYNRAPQSRQLLRPSL